MTTYREVNKSDQEELFRLVCEFPTPIAISKQFFDDMFRIVFLTRGLSLWWQNQMTS